MTPRKPDKSEKPETPAPPPSIEFDDEVDDSGEPEPSLLDVEALLKAHDESERATIDPPAPSQPEPFAPLPTDPLLLELRAHVVGDQPGDPHALDLAPVNSKLVVTKVGVILATPEGVTELPKTDPANKLPEGARIQKIQKVADRTGAVHFHATQLSAVEDHPPLVTDTARDAIAGFLAHFHPRGLHGVG